MVLITSSSLNPRTFATSAGFCIPNLHVLILGHITSTTLPYLQIPADGTHRWHTTEENGALVALGPVFLRHMPPGHITKPLLLGSREDQTPCVMFVHA